MVRKFVEQFERVHGSSENIKSQWINLIAPTAPELRQIEESYGVPMEFLTAALDPDERARFESEDNVLLILLRIPLVNDEQEENDPPYITRPLGIIMTIHAIITVCTRENSIINDFIDSKVKNFNPEHKLRFILQIFYLTALKYLRFLKEIDNQTHNIEKELQDSLKNKEIMRLLSYEKSLVFFTTSLRSNQIMMERLKKISFFRLMLEEDRELLEDVIIDNTQAIEMAHIYTNILSGLMDTFASVISNNLNNVMRSLTKITIILMAPTLIASIYGMNVKLPIQDSPFAFLVVISSCIIVALLVMLIFTFKNRF